jgi:HEAT repeat protein
VTRVSPVCLVLTVALMATDAAAQSAPVLPSPPPSPFPPLHAAPLPLPTGLAHGLESTTDLRERFGVEAAARLLHSIDADDRLRGLERAATIRSNEGMNLLVHALDAGGAARFDARALIVVARGLAPYTAQSDARSALQTIVSSPSGPARAPARPPEEAPDDVLLQGRIDLARGTAALALAQSQEARAVEMLVQIARSPGSGQAFAASALLAFPPAGPSQLGPSSMNAPVMDLAAELGDLRTLDGMLTVARSGEPATRLAALRAMAQMGDARVLDVARSLVTGPDPVARVAAVEALAALHAPDRLRALDTLLANDKTALAGARLAAVEQDEGVIKSLAARVVASADASIRRAVVHALGRSRVPAALEVLVRLVGDSALASDAAYAVARSPNPRAMEAIVAMLGSEPTRRLGARAYFARAVMRGEHDPRARSALTTLSRASDGRDRAVGLAVLAALGETNLVAALADRDARVRRALAMASLSRKDTTEYDALLQRLAVEPDPTTQETLAIGLVGGDPNARVTTLVLQDRAQSGQPDALLAALALARRAGVARKETVDALLASPDPVMRAHVALGLGTSAAADAVGRLASAYAFEPNGEVRRTIVTALAARTGDATSPERIQTLEVAAHLDPDSSVRTLAARAIAGLPVVEARTTGHEVAWLRLEPSDGAMPVGTMTGAILRSDGLAVPVAFDDEGFAVVEVPPGECRLVLAPRLPAYDASRP